MIDTQYMREGTILLSPTGDEIEYVCSYPMNSNCVIVKVPSDNKRPMLEVIDKSLLKVKPLHKDISINVYALDDNNIVYSFNSFEEALADRKKFDEARHAIKSPWKFVGTYGLRIPI